MTRDTKATNGNRDPSWASLCRAATLAYALLAVVSLAIALTLAQPAFPDYTDALLFFAAVVFWGVWAVVPTLALLCALGRWRTPRTPRAQSVLLWLLLVCCTGLTGGVGVLLGWIEAPSTVWRAIGIAATLGLGIGWAVAGWQERQALIDAARTAQAAALQARTHPHFLLNSLNVIAGLLPDAPHRAERAIENLAVLLQAALSDPHPWPLAAELDAARAYLALAQLRYGDRLVLDWKSDCPEAILTKRIPRWCLVPLIENAVTHGVARRREPTTVSVTLRVIENQLTVRVGNPVAERAQNPARSDSGFGVGLAAVTRQIAAAGGTVQQVQDAGWHWVAITLPLDASNGG